MTVTRAEILEFLNRGSDESKKLRADEVAFLIQQRNRSVKPAPAYKPLELPCLIELPSSYGGNRSECLRWIYRERGELRLSDEAPNFRPVRKPDDQAPEDGQGEQQPEKPGELENAAGPHKRKQSGKTTYRDAIPSSASPDDLKKLLKKKGLSLSEQQQEIVRGKANRAKISERVAATGLPRSTLYHKEKKLQEEVEVIRTKPLPSKASKKPVPSNVESRADYLTRRLIPPGPVLLSEVSDGEDLRELDKKAAQFVRTAGDYYPGLKWQLNQVWKGTLAGKIIHLIRWCPRALLDSQDGPELVKSLVNLLEDAKYGDKDVRAAAWKELAILTKPGRGNPPRREFDPFMLGIIAEEYHCRVTFFQRNWKAIESKPGHTNAAALEEIREAHREELARFKHDERLRSFLLSDPLEAACRLAAAATKIDAKTFKGAFAELRRTHERWHKRASSNPFSAPSTPPKT